MHLLLAGFNSIISRFAKLLASFKLENNGEFKLNNNYRAFYARAFMKKYPEYAGFFRLREQTSEKENASLLPELTPDDYREVSLL